MARFIEIKNMNNVPIFVNVEHITYVKEGGTYRKISWLCGDDEYCLTKEKYASIVGRIKSALRMCEYENEKQDH